MHMNNYHMGTTAENIAEKFNISKDEQDKFAVNSQNKEKTLKRKVLLMKKYVKLM